MGRGLGCSMSGISEVKGSQQMPDDPSSASATKAAVRANAYAAMARALEQPRHWGSDLSDLLATALGAMPDPLPRLGEQLSRQVEEVLEDREAISVAHAELFLGPFEVRVAPWASFYLEDEPRLMGPTSQHAAVAYAEAGLAPGEASEDTPDHITHELEFMYFLAFNEAVTGDTVWRSRQVSFWREHLGRWLTSFASELASARTHLFYERLAKSLKTLAANEEQELGMATEDTGTRASRDRVSLSGGPAHTDTDVGSANVSQLRSVLGINYQGE